MIPVTNQIIWSPKDKINAKKMLKSPNLSILEVARRTAVRESLSYGSEPQNVGIWWRMIEQSAHGH